jgi:sulfur transfer protein SufE
LIKAKWTKVQLSEIPTSFTNFNSRANFFSDLKNRFITPSNTTQTLLNLVSLGNNWISHKVGGYDDYISVSGCLSTVKLKIDLYYDADGVERVKMHGFADSKVVLGLVAFLFLVSFDNFCFLSKIIFLQGLEQMTVAEICALDPSSVTRSLEADCFLPATRVSGFQNVIKTVQSILMRSRLNPETSPTPAISLSASVLVEKVNEVAVLVSGGVDSSVALQLLVNQGVKVRAYYLKIWLDEEVSHLNLDHCPWEEDIHYASKVCESLNIPLEIISLQNEYWKYVVNYTLSEASVGRTPNPDIMCNSFIKFGIFYDYIGK